jgi:hypothetical protein
MVNKVSPVGVSLNLPISIIEVDIAFKDVCGICMA